MASGLSMPIGFKNGTIGNTNICVDAILSSTEPHRFLGVTKQGLAGIVLTTGNPDCHVVLRGGSQTGPNFTKEHVEKVAGELRAKNCFRRIVVDCSHGNSKKLHTNQPKVLSTIASELGKGPEPALVGGVMIESNLVEGAQKLDPGKTDPKSLIVGQSVTDACVNMDTTATMLREFAAAVKARRKA